MEPIAIFFFHLSSLISGLSSLIFHLSSFISRLSSLPFTFIFVMMCIIKHFLIEILSLRFIYLETRFLQKR